jgi:hypothetical protein
MSHKVMMGSRAMLVASGLMLAVCVGAPVAAEPSSSPAANPLEATPPVHYLNLMGYEGIPTLGFTAFVNGPPPPIGDWVTTHCRFIDVANTNIQDYFLHYPLHLPDRAKILYIQIRVAHFTPVGGIWAQLRSRPWNSRDLGDIEVQVGATVAQSDQVLNMQNLNLEVDNTTTSYWIDVTPSAAANPGEVCVYGVHVAYIPYIFTDGFESGDTAAWSSEVQ